MNKVDNDAALKVVQDATARGEPVFVLRAQDMLAARTVLHWAGEAMALGAPALKIVGATERAVEMFLWGQLHGIKVPD